MCVSEARCSFFMRSTPRMKGITVRFHTPGRPEDLPPFDVLWSRAAALEAGGSENQHSYTAAFVRHDDGGGNEWRLTLVEGGRGVLVGVDHECGAHVDIKGYDPYVGPDRPWTCCSPTCPQRRKPRRRFWNLSIYGLPHPGVRKDPLLSIAYWNWRSRTAVPRRNGARHWIRP